MLSKNKGGFSIIELLIAIVFISVITLVIINASFYNNNLRIKNEERTRALFYATEAIEATKLLSWGDLVAGNYYPAIESNQWHLLAGSQTLDQLFQRQIIVSDVYRANSDNGNVNGSIVTSGGYLDPDTKLITVQIDWIHGVYQGEQMHEEISTYLHRFATERWTQTDWAGGPGQANWLVDSKYYSHTSGLAYGTAGIVTLNSGFVNWNNASSSAELALGNSRDANDIMVAGNIAYIVTDDNTSGSNPELYIVDVGDHYDPQILSQLNLQIDNNANGIAVANGYAYIVSSDDSDEVIIANVNNINNPQYVGKIDLSGTTNAIDVAVDGNNLYILRSSTISKYDISDPSLPQFSNQYSITSAYKFFIAGDYIYVATGDSSRELHAVNKNTLTWAGEYDLSGSLVARDVYVRGNYAYVTTNVNSNKEFYILNISNLSSISVAGSWEVNYNVFAVTLTGAYAVLSVDNASQEILILDISFPATISVAGGTSLTNDVNSLAADCTGIYTATEDEYLGLQIIANGETDCEITNSASLESSTFDTGSSAVAYNWIKWEGSQPTNTTIRFQLAASDNQLGPWNYLGPDGSSSTYYTTASKELINYNQTLNKRYLRYKLYLDSQADLQAPTLESLTISYSVN